MLRAFQDGLIRGRGGVVWMAEHERATK